MIILSVDPGLDGAWAAIKDGRLIALKDLPTVGDGTRRMVSGTLLADQWSTLIEREGPVSRVVVERVAARPGQGVSSMYRFGFVCGVIDGVAGGLNLPISYVTPTVWKRHFNLPSDKDAARALAVQTWPEIAAQAFSRVKDHGKAEAALIGLWSWRAAVVAGEVAA